MSYRVIPAPHEYAREVLMRTFTTAPSQRQAIGQIASLLVAEATAATPDDVITFLNGHPDSSPNLASGTVACARYLDLRGELPTNMITARLVGGQPRQPEADLSITYLRDEPEPAPAKSWDFVRGVR